MDILFLTILFFPFVLLGLITHLVWAFLRLGWRIGIKITEWLGRDR